MIFVSNLTKLHVKQAKSIHTDYMNIKLKRKHGFNFLPMSNKNMADAQTCKVEEMVTPLNTGSANNIRHYVQVSETP